MAVIHRTSCRALLLTPERGVILIKMANPNGKWIGWIAPGGGMDAGESEEQGLRRELREELGLENFSLGPRVWKRFHSFEWKGDTFAQHEVFFVLEVSRFEPKPQIDPTISEVLDFREFRWWKIDDLLESREEFAPRKLPALLDALIADGAPPDAI